MSGGGGNRAPVFEGFVAHRAQHRAQSPRHRQGAGAVADRQSEVDILAQDRLEGLEIRARLRPGLISFGSVAGRGLEEEQDELPFFSSLLAA